MLCSILFVFIIFIGILIIIRIESRIMLIERELFEQLKVIHVLLKDKKDVKK